MSAPIDLRIMEAARFYAPNSERLQRAFAYGWQHGGQAPGMSTWERDAAEHGRRRAALERRNYGQTAVGPGEFSTIEAPAVSPAQDR